MLTVREGPSSFGSLQSRRVSSLRSPLLDNDDDDDDDEDEEDRNEHLSDDEYLLQHSHSINRSPSKGGGSNSRESKGTSMSATSPLRVTLNMMNAMEGMGILTLPLTIKLAGAASLGMLFLGAALACCTAVMITASLYDAVPIGGKATADRTAKAGSLGRGGGGGLAGQESVEKREGGGKEAGAVRWVRTRASYAENGEAAFGNCGRRTVILVQVLSLGTVSALFCVLCGASLKDILRDLLPQDDSNAPTVHWAQRWLAECPVRGWSVVFVALASPSVMVQKAKVLSVFSGMSLLVLILLFSAMCCSAAHSVRVGGEGFWHRRFVDELELVRWADLPCALSIIIFSFSCHTMMPAMEATLPQARRAVFPAVAASAFGAAAVFKAGFVVAAWLAFGPSLTDVATDRVRPVWLKATATFSVILCTLMSLPLLLFVLFRVLALALPTGASYCEGEEEGEGGPSRRRLRTWLRILVVVLVGGLAVGMGAELGPAMSYFGSLLSTLSVIVLPTLFHARLRAGEGRLTRAGAAAHALLIAFGVVVGVLGLATTIDGCAKVQ